MSYISYMYITCQHRTKQRKVNILFTHFPNKTKTFKNKFNTFHSSRGESSNRLPSASSIYYYLLLVNEDIGVKSVELFDHVSPLEWPEKIFTLFVTFKSFKPLHIDICKIRFNLNCFSIWNWCWHFDFCNKSTNMRRTWINRSFSSECSFAKFPNFHRILSLRTVFFFILQFVQRNIAVWCGYRPSMNFKKNTKHLPFIFPFRLGLCGNWIEIAYGTRSGSVRVIVQHPETVGHSPQLFQTFTVHQSPVTKVKLSEQFLISVCSEYNHVRTWRVPRFRGMISTQPGSTPEASFKVSLKLKWENRSLQTVHQFSISFLPIY